MISKSFGVSRSIFWSYFEGTDDDIKPENPDILGVYIAQIRFVFKEGNVHLQIETLEENAYNTWGRSNIVVYLNDKEFDGINESERYWKISNKTMNYDEIWNFTSSCIGKYVPIGFKFK